MLLPLINKIVSSAKNNDIVHLQTFDKSVIYNKNNKGHIDVCLRDTFYF